MPTLAGVAMESVGKMPMTARSRGENCMMKSNGNNEVSAELSWDVWD